VRHKRREKTGGQQSHVSLSTPKAAEPSTMPFAQRLTCTIDDACEVTGLGRKKLYELIGAGRIVTTTIGCRRLVVVRSLLALLDTNQHVELATRNLAMSAVLAIASLDRPTLGSPIILG
jgi:hypothetical protein